MSKFAPGLGLALSVGLAASAAAGERPSASGLTPAEAVVGHCAAWNTTDRTERDRLLERVLAPDGVYADPTPTYAAGRVALSTVIADFQRQTPGARFKCSAPQTHHGAMRVSWLLKDGDGKTITQGQDFYELAPNGQIRRITGFFGPPPSVAP
ncbi:MAG: nuclear transport factor 2 family protein [Proteobacteria bacterium]|nr:nuclear transport factor 2 family protein [Pseudomonadota bacterium]